APQPASDGKRIFAFFSSNDLVCLDLDGRLLWYRGLNYDYPNANNSLGMASSPIVVGDTVIAQVEADAVSFATGLDVATGKPRWKIDRPRKANWTSPFVIQGEGGRNIVVLQSSAGLQAVDPYTGKSQWNYTDGAATIPSSTVANQIIYAASNGITAIEPQAGGTTRKLWQAGNLSLATASPLVADGRLYTLNRSSVLTSADAKTGKPVWKLRLKGPISASPLYASGHLYVVNETGLVQVVELGEEKGKVVSTYDLGETVLATPAIADDAVFIRGDTDGHLSTIGHKPASP
ncbi:MAG: PQQ-like beta-propeller repeat protein, partial [Pirellulales bacterium]|nr:PQQ-like beta-propeller repeat protein [Pirellulales bacterium]